MTKDQKKVFNKLSKKLEQLTETVPQPDNLIAQLNRMFNMTEISELVNDGKRQSIYHWQNRTREPGWQNYIKLLYACGYSITRRKSNGDTDTISETDS